MTQSPPIVALRGASITFGGTPLWQDIDLAIGRGDKLCLIGRNGSGKSTLLKALAGDVALDSGERFLQPGVRIAYLAQEPSFEGLTTVADYVAAGLGSSADAQRHRVEAVLDALSVPGDADPRTLSGGEARRAALARALVDEPDVLLLDEPTNHLDLPTIEWLEGRLESFRGGLLVISHDRTFLRRLSRRTVWLDRGGLRESDKGFEAFEAWRDAVFEAEDQAAHKLDRKIAAETKWLREGISARRTRNMGRVRALQDLRRERADRIKGGAQVKLTVAEAETSGRLVIEAENISLSFDTPNGPRPIVRGFSTRILRGDRIGLIGPNGAGKTTLLRLLTGERKPDSGTVRLGANLQPIYFDQKRQSLDPEATIRQVLCPVGGDTVTVGGQPKHVAGYMRDFLFDPRAIDTPTKSLSGGERNRLLLARLFAQPSNLMILDEPTNDLDMDTLDLLEEVLNDYPGTLLLVSHDRDFLDRLVTSTIALDGSGNAAEYVGGYSDFLRQRPAEAEPAAQKRRAPQPPEESKPRVPRKLGYRQQRELDELPGRIETLGREIEAIERMLADPDLFARDPTMFERRTQELQRKLAERQEAEDRWLELEMLREALET